MTAEIVNLRHVRKTKLRAGKAADGAANRALYGRTRAAREIETLERERATRGLDGHRLERSDSGDGDIS